jgi:hypothetical protein
MLLKFVNKFLILTHLNNIQPEVLQRTNPPTFLAFFNNLSSLQRYDTEQNYGILQRVVQRLPKHNLKISHHRHI